MKLILRFLLVLALVLGASCASISDEHIVLPDSTPFDTDALARANYLDAYRDGYRAAVKGHNTAPDFFIRGPYRFARELGWRAGVADGFQSLQGHRGQPR